MAWCVRSSTRVIVVTLLRQAPSANRHAVRRAIRRQHRIQHDRAVRVEAHPVVRKYRVGADGLETVFGDVHGDPRVAQLHHQGIEFSRARAAASPASAASRCWKRLLASVSTFQRKPRRPHHQHGVAAVCPAVCSAIVASLGWIVCSITPAILTLARRPTRPDYDRVSKPYSPAAACCGFHLLRTNLIKKKLRPFRVSGAAPPCPQSVSPRCARAPAAWSSSVRDEAQSLGRRGAVHGQPAAARTGVRARASRSRSSRKSGLAATRSRCAWATRRSRCVGAKPASCSSNSSRQRERDCTPPRLDPMRLALVGVPNCGKTALFNRLTGSRQKVANYAGVTVERKEGSFVGPAQAAPVQGARPARRVQPHAHDAR